MGRAHPAQFDLLHFVLFAGSVAGPSAIFRRNGQLVRVSAVDALRVAPVANLLGVMNPEMGLVVGVAHGGEDVVAIERRVAAGQVDPMMGSSTVVSTVT